MPLGSPEPKTMQLVTLEKGGEIYSFSFDVRDTETLFTVAERYASDPELSFDSVDVADLRVFVRQVLSRLQARSHSNIRLALGKQVTEYLKGKEDAKN